MLVLETAKTAIKTVSFAQKTGRHGGLFFMGNILKFPLTNKEK